MSVESTKPSESRAITQKETSVRIVGIAAAAVGLEGLKPFFQQIRPKTGLAFVVIQHPAPDHKIIRNESLSLYTDMQIHIVRDGMEVESNMIYLMPPGKSLAVRNNRLWLTEPLPSEAHYPIDHFFHSLALELGQQALAVVLSDTGVDGTRGIASIKSKGGIVFLQSVGITTWDEMLRSAVESRHVDDLMLPAVMSADGTGLPSRRSSPS